VRTGTFKFLFFSQACLGLVPEQPAALIASSSRAPGTSTDIMATELDELIGFLTDSRAPIRKHALDIVLGLTGSAEGLSHLRSKAKLVVAALLRMVCSQDPKEATSTVSALTNCSQDPGLVEVMLKSNCVNRLMDYLKEDTCTCTPRLLVMLLSNLSVTEQGSKELLQLGQGKLEGLHVAVLLKRFVVSGVNWAPNVEDPYEHVSNILVNITRFKEGRVLLLQPGRGILQVLAAQLKAPSTLRKQGAAGAIRNCCMSTEADGTLEHVVGDLNVLESLLHPVSGQEPKEKDDLVRECMADSICVLAATELGLNRLKEIDAYSKVHKGYEYETHAPTCKALEQAATYFLFNADVEKNGKEGVTVQEEGVTAQEESPAS